MTEAQLASLKEAIYKDGLANDEALVEDHIQRIDLTPPEAQSIYDLSRRLIERIQNHPGFNKGLDAFMAEYNLDTDEGIRLMTLAEALIRIPDEDTREALIKSKLTGADWADHIGKSLSPFVNSSTRALLFTSSILEVETRIPFLADIVKRLGEPGIRMGVELAMKMFSHHFVMAEDLKDTSKALIRDRDKYRYSFDMLGEAALTREDADKYYESYKAAILFASQYANAAISIKLSALHPRYDILQKSRVATELLPKLLALFSLAKEKDVQVTMDAEEADRLELGLDIVEMILRDGRTLGWNKMGLAVQAYSKRGLAALKYLQALAATYNEKLFVRLVKGAYWDTEVKMAQVQGLADYPVFTAKADTDIAYLSCARYLIDACPDLFPQFATHNVQTVASLLHWTQGKSIQFEFQRLHGMGDQLYESVLADYPRTRCCIYAPVGRQKELLPYLIRRLLENTANSSFVNQLARNTGLDELIRHPVETRALNNKKLRRPADLYSPGRQNSAGLNVRYLSSQRLLLQQMDEFSGHKWNALPSPELDTSSVPHDKSQAVYSPGDNNRVVGEVVEATPAQARLAVDIAAGAFVHWQGVPLKERLAIFERFATLLEKHTPELLVLMAREAGKTVQDGLGEVREAVDFVRYYAAQMKTLEPPQT
ncbi:MAG: proline dehydrogenase family protein, partial [Gammaproteobacteria bacterium]|nr:proline dehydrogenase family protein [Gammaproteobacteria bacterium]